MNTDTIPPIGSVSPDGSYVFTGTDWVRLRLQADAVEGELGGPSAATDPSNEQSPRRSYRWTSWAAASLIAVGVLAAVGSMADPAASLDATTTPSATTAVEDTSDTTAPEDDSFVGEAIVGSVDPESEFLAAVRSRSSLNISDDSLLYHGHSACERIGVGVPAPMVVNTKSAFLGDWTGGLTVGAAVAWLCPEHEVLVRPYL